MIRLFLLSVLSLVVSLFTFAQSPPEAFNYSAVAKSTEGVPIENSTVGVQFSIHHTAALGPVVYQENHFVNTDNNGLFNVHIGTGAVQSGAFEAIQWGSDTFFLEVGLDVEGGTDYTSMGTTQFVSVPYAIHSATADSIVGGGNSFSGDYNDLSNQPITVNGVSPNGDTLFLSNGEVFFSGGGTGSGFTHYIGEEFGGGVIFELWKDSNGGEHGLIVSVINLPGEVPWSNINEQIGPSAQSWWDGQSNTQAIVSQSGHTTSAAQLCMDYNGGGFNDWYLPAMEEVYSFVSQRHRLKWALQEIEGSDQILIDILETEGTGSFQFISSTESPPDVFSDLFEGIRIHHPASSVGEVVNYGGGIKSTIISGASKIRAVRKF